MGCGLGQRGGALQAHRGRDRDHGRRGPPAEPAGLLVRKRRREPSETMTSLDEEISRAKQALLDDQAELDRYAEAAAGACCPTCFHGRPYSDLADRAERRGQHLAELLRKRARPEDLDLATAIDMSAWP